MSKPPRHPKALRLRPPKQANGARLSMRGSPWIVAFGMTATLSPPLAWGQQADSGALTPPMATPADDHPTGATLAPVTVQGRQENGLRSNELSLSRLPADVRDIPQSVTIVDRTVMDSQGATTLASALRNIPGLTISGAEGSQIGTNINLNGYTARTDIYLDGARDRSQYYRDTFALDAIEVLMGPSSMLFGRGSTGGIINQVSKKPTLKEATEVQVMATTTGLVRTVMDTNQPLSDTSALRVAAMKQDGPATTRDQTGLQDYGIAPSLKLGIGEPTTITLSALLQHNNDQVDYGLPNLNGAPANVDASKAYGFNDDRTISDVATLGSVIEHRLTGSSSLRNQTQLSQVTTNARETAPQGIGTIAANGSFVPLSTGTTAVPVAASSSLPLSQLWVRQQSHDRVITDDSVYNVTEFNGDYTYAGLKHAVLLGAELGWDYYQNQNSYRNGSCNGVALNPVGGTSGYVACTPLLQPGGGVSPANAPSVPGNFATGHATTSAVFANDTLDLTEHVKLVGGLRYDLFDASISNSLATSSTPAAASQTVNFTSVRTGGIWQPTQEQSYYVSYSTSFNPTLEQLVNTTGTTTPLPPEQNIAYETGGKWDLNEGKLSLTAAAFQITQYNSRSSDSSGTYTATGTIQVTGKRMGLAGQVTEQLQVFAGYTHLDATIIDAIAPGTAGQTPANTPHDSGSLWSTYRLTPLWELGGGATYSSERYANNTDLVQVGAYLRWDAMIAYHQPKYDIRLNLFNVFNAQYYDALIASDGGRSVPGLGQSAAITLAYRL